MVSLGRDELGALVWETEVGAGGSRVPLVDCGSRPEPDEQQNKLYDGISIKITLHDVYKG